MTHWLISDTHFWHKNIIKYCNRQYDDEKHMNLEIVRNINRQVSKEDIIWHLGDFAFGREVTGPEKIATIRKQINCQNINLILGNHDRLIKENIGLRALFSMVIPCFVGFIQGIPVVLNHRPVEEEKETLNKRLINDWIYRYPQSVVFFGHVHNNSHIGDPRNMSVENIGYNPVEFTKAIQNVKVGKNGIAAHKARLKSVEEKNEQKPKFNSPHS